MSRIERRDVQADTLAELTRRGIVTKSRAEAILAGRAGCPTGEKQRAASSRLRAALRQIEREGEGTPRPIFRAPGRKP